MEKNKGIFEEVFFSCPFENLFELLISDCEYGTFGLDCSYHCSGNCLDNATCNSTNGHCDRGCDSGYVGIFCNKSMYVSIKPNTINLNFHSIFFFRSTCSFNNAK